MIQGVMVRNFYPLYLFVCECCDIQMQEVGIGFNHHFLKLQIETAEKMNIKQFKRKKH